MALVLPLNQRFIHLNSSLVAGPREYIKKKKKKENEWMNELILSIRFPRAHSNHIHTKPVIV